MQQLRIIAISSIIGIMTVFGVVNFALAECAAGGQACALSGLEQSNGAAGNLPGPTSANDNGAWLTGQVGNIIGNILAFVGLIFMGLILYAGYLWMTAGGDSAKTTKAISIMTDAVVGLIVIAAAYLLTQYVGNVVLGSLTTAGTQ